MTKNTPKKPAVTVRAINFPASRLGESDKRPRAYIAGIAETNRMPIPPAALNFELDLWFRGHELEVLTCSRRLDGTVLLRSERTTQKLAKNRVLGYGLGQWFDNGITEDRLKRVEVDEHQESGPLERTPTPNSC